MSREYLNRELLTARVGGTANYLKLTNDETPTGTDPDEDVEELLLGQVDRMMDAYASQGGYAVPLARVNVEFVQPWLLDIANYKARTRAPRKASDDDLLQYQNAIAWLEAVAAGKVRLPEGPSIGVSSTTGISIDSERQMFNRRRLRMW